MRILKFKSFYDRGDRNYLVLALVEQEDLFYVVHIVVREPYRSKKRAEEMIYRMFIVESEDGLVGIFHQVSFDTEASARWVYAQSCG